jgi:hypothetical protein
VAATPKVDQHPDIGLVLAPGVSVDPVTGEVIDRREKSAQASKDYASSPRAQQFAQVLAKVQSARIMDPTPDLGLEPRDLTGEGRFSRGRTEAETRAAVGAIAALEQQAEARTARQRRPQTPQGPRSGPLGTNAGTVSAISEATSEVEDLKAQRYAGRTYLWDVSTVESVRKCGRVSVRPGGVVGGRISVLPDGGRAAGLSGLHTCGSPWSCPVCSSKIAWVRAQELAEVLGKAMWEDGAQVVLATFTLRHSKEMPLTDTWDGCLSGWSRVITGRAWAGETPKEFAERKAKWEVRLARPLAQRPREREATYAARCLAREAKMLADPPVRRLGLKHKYGLRGFFRAIECTRGCEHGWHPHVHVALVFDKPHSPEMVQHIGEQMYALWAKGIATKGFTAIRDSGGLDIRISKDPEGLGQYLTKQNAMSLAREVTFGQQKQGRMESRTPFQILADLIAFGVGDEPDDLDTPGDPDDMSEPDDLALWHEWERGSRGRKAVGWSSGHPKVNGKACECGEIDCKGLREQFAVAEDLRTDEEIAAEDVGEADSFVMGRDTWRKVYRVQLDLVRAMEAEGLPGARAWLDSRALVYDLPPRETSSPLSPSCAPSAGMDT